MKNLAKKLLNLLVIALTLGFVLYTAFKNGDLNESLKSLSSMKPLYVCIGFVCTFASIFLYGVGAWSALKQMGHKISLLHMFGIAVISEFYSGITPGATGGQPVAVYQMHKRGLPVGDSTSSLLMPHICFHIMLVVCTTVLGIVFRRFIAEQTGSRLWILILGYVLNILMTFGFIMLCFTKKPVRLILKFVVWLCKKLHFKKIAAKEQSMLKTADRFYNGMHRLYNNRVEFVQQLIYAAARLLLLCSVQYWVYLGLGLRGAGFGAMLTMGVMQYCAAAYTPLPGASGAQEGVFALFFAGVMPGSLTVAGMLAWRFLSFYSVLAIGLVVYLCMKVRTRVEIKHETGQSAPLLQPDFVESGRELIDSEDSTETNE
ncbi:MAG: flippase-like domain-containing protein [Clostridia bacterium]|nr:flippase-like domain-containing protein [Clostridia bacterium]